LDTLEIGKRQAEDLPKKMGGNLSEEGGELEGKKEIEEKDREVEKKGDDAPLGAAVEILGGEIKSFEPVKAVPLYNFKGLLNIYRGASDDSWSDSDSESDTSSVITGSDSDRLQEDLELLLGGWVDAF